MKKKKDLKVYIPLTVTIIAVIAVAIYWYIDFISYIKTDDAYVTSDVVTVSPKIMGRLSATYVDEGDSVKAGQLLAEIDSTDMLAQKAQIFNSKLQADAGKTQAEAKLSLDQKNTEVLRIAMEKSKEDFTRITAQYNGGVVSKEQFDHQKKALETAQAQYEASQAQLKLSKTQIEVGEAAIKTAASQIDVINTQLKNTRLYAPADGIIAKRWLQAGDIANAGQSVFSLNKSTKFWINIYLEETKVETLHIGQSAVFTLDTYPDATFTGKIFMIGSTTASQFSLVPANNASGNFTKITQRVPVKISIDSTSKGKNLSEYRLMTGMSAVVKIIR